MKLTIKIKASDVGDFESLMQEMIRVTGRDAKIVVRNTAKDFYFIAMTETPQSKTSILGRKINTFGFAKAGWFTAGNALGIPIKSKAHLRGGRKGAQSGSFHNGLNSRERPSFTLSNEIPFIEELPGLILPIAMTKTQLKLAKTLTRITRRGWQSTWKR